MGQLLFVIVIYIFVLLVYYLSKRKYRKYSNSIINKIIDNEYFVWYKKEKHGAAINNKYNSSYEIDKYIWILKLRLERKGLTKYDVGKYTEFLKNDTPQKINGFNIIITIFGFIGINSLAGFLGVIKDYEPYLKQLSSFFSINSNNIYIVSYVILFFIYIFLTFFILYFVSNIDTMNIKAQKIFILERVICLFDFVVDSRVVKFENIKSARKNTVYVNLEVSQSDFDKRFTEKYGPIIYKNFYYLLNLKLVKYILSINFLKCIKAVIGVIVSVCFPILFLSITGMIWKAELESHMGNQVINKYKILSCIPLFFYYFTFITLLDASEKNNNNLKTRKGNCYYLKKKDKCFIIWSGNLYSIYCSNFICYV